MVATFRELQARYGIADTKAERPREPRGKLDEFPEGRLSPTDEGALEFGLAAWKGHVVVRFTTPVREFALPPDLADRFIALLTKAKNAALAPSDRPN